MVTCVGNSLEIFSWTEEEGESDPGEFVDGLLMRGAGLIGLAKGL